jgi:hypothetical protein
MRIYSFIKRFDIFKYSTFLGILICSILAYWLVTNGTLNLTKSEGCYFDSLAKNISTGRLDVVPAEIGGEGIINKGKWYGYFGTFPAVIRLVNNYFFPSMYCKWNRVILFFSYATVLLISLLFYRSIRYKYFSKKTDRNYEFIYVILMGLTTSSIFIVSRSYYYHEAIAVGVTTSLCAYYMLYLFLIKGKKLYLYLCLLFVLFAIHSRVPDSLGTILSLVLVCIISIVYYFKKILNSRRFVFYLSPTPKSMVMDFKKVFVIIIGVSIILISSLYVNYVKFDNFFEFLPLEKHIQFIDDQDRLKRLLKYNDGKLINLYNTVHNLQYYFGYGGLIYRDRFPWVALDGQRGHILRLESIDGIGQNASVLYLNPLLYILSIVGIVVAFLKKKFFEINLILIGSLFTILLTSSSIGIDQRYHHDFYPFLLFTSAFAIAMISLISKFRKFIFGIVIILTIYSIYVNLAISVVFQREVQWEFEPEKRVSFINFSRKMDYLRYVLLFNAEIPISKTTDDTEAPTLIVPGQIWQIGNNTFWFDGNLWRPVVLKSTNIQYREYEFDIELKKDRFIMNKIYSFISAYDSISGDTNKTSISKEMDGFYFWQAIPEKSHIKLGPVDLPDSPFKLKIITDGINEKFTVIINRKKILESFYKYANIEGKNIIAGGDILVDKVSMLPGVINRGFVNNIILLPCDGLKKLCIISQ